MEVARYFQNAQSRKLVIFLQRVLQLLLCYIVMQDIQLFYRGQPIFIVTCFLAQSDCRNVLPEHRNTIIKQQLCGEGLPSLLPLLQASVFQEKQGILQQIILCPSKNQKKLVSGLVTQIFSPKVIQESTTILQLKVYFIYVVRKLVGHPS